MATKIPGETYRGNTLHVPLSADGQIALYVWPLRLLKIQGKGCGGPTIGVEVGNEEVLRFDCHDTPAGHWHGGAMIACKRRAPPIAIFPSMSNTWRIRSSGP